MFTAESLTCVVGDLEQAVRITWEDYNNVTITDDMEGYTINHTTSSIEAENVQTSTLTITAAKLETIVRYEGLATNWACKVQSVRFPQSTIARKNLKLEYLIIG